MTNILLVEDDEMIVKNLTEFLIAENFSVKSAGGQSLALELIKNNAFDLVLLDLSSILIEVNLFLVESEKNASGRKR